MTPKIIDRYLLKEILVPTGIGMGIFTCVFLVSKLFRVTEMVVDKGVPIRYAIELFLCLIPAFLVFVSIQLWHNEIRYGHMLEFGYSVLWDQLGFSNPLLTGLWGLFLSPGKSFFLYSPVTILGVLSLPGFFRRKRNEAFLFIGRKIHHQDPLGRPIVLTH